MQATPSKHKGTPSYTKRELIQEILESFIPQSNEPLLLLNRQVFQEDDLVHIGRDILPLTRLAEIAESWLNDNPPSVGVLRHLLPGKYLVVWKLLNEAYRAGSFRPSTSSTEDPSPDREIEPDHRRSAPTTRRKTVAQDLAVASWADPPQTVSNTHRFLPDLSNSYAEIDHLANVLAKVRGRKVSTTRPRVTMWAEGITSDYRDATMRLIATEWEKHGWSHNRAVDALREMLAQVESINGRATLTDMLLHGSVMEGDRGSSPAVFNTILFKILEQQRLPMPSLETDKAGVMFYIDDCVFTGSTLRRHVERMVGNRQGHRDEPKIVILTLAAHQPQWDQTVRHLHRLYRSVEAYTTQHLDRSLAPGSDVIDRLMKIEPSFHSFIRSEFLPNDPWMPSHRTGDVDDLWLAGMAGLLAVGIQKMETKGANPKGHTQNMRPMGFDPNPGLGFGTPFVSWRNIPNGAPLALWSRPRPLMDRITNASLGWRRDQ